MLKSTIPVDPGNDSTPGGLWSLIFGVGGTNGGDPNTLSITDGIDGETHGLLAAIAPVREPGSLALLAGRSACSRPAALGSGVRVRSFDLTRRRRS